MERQLGRQLRLVEIRKHQSGLQAPDFRKLTRAVRRAMPAWRRRRIFHRRFGSNNAGGTDKREPASGGVIGRGLGVAEKRPSLFALLLLLQNA